MSENNNKEYKIGFLVTGAILVGIGIMFLVANLVPRLGVGKFWPLFLLIPAAILIAVWIHAGQRAAGVILPIVILVFFCGYFIWLNFTSWYNAASTWPNFLIGPGLGFLGLFLVTKKWGYMIPSFILLLLAAIFYAAIIENSIFVGILLVVMGLVIILKPFFLKEKAKVE